MTAKRITALVSALIALGFWLSAGFYCSTGLIMTGMKSAGLAPRWAPLGGLAIALAGIAISIWALRRWSK